QAALRAARTACEDGTSEKSRQQLAGCQIAKRCPFRGAPARRPPSVARLYVSSGRMFSPSRKQADAGGVIICHCSPGELGVDWKTSLAKLLIRAAIIRAPAVWLGPS